MVQFGSGEEATVSLTIGEFAGFFTRIDACEL